MARNTQAGTKRAAKSLVTNIAGHKTAGGEQLASDEIRSPVTAEERHRLIAEAAYCIAERRGFEGDAALDDWLQAEADVDARLSAGD